MGIITYTELERLASAGGYDARGRDIGRITVAGVHQVYAGLARHGGGEVQSAMLAASRLRRWFLHGDGTPPPVRGAGFVHSNRDIWMAYTTYENPALVRGSSRALAELRSYLAMAITPDYDGSLQARTNPPVNVEAADGKVILAVETRSRSARPAGRPARGALALGHHETQGQARHPLPAVVVGRRLTPPCRVTAAIRRRSPPASARTREATRSRARRHPGRPAPHRWTPARRRSGP